MSDEPIEFHLNEAPVVIPDDGCSLLEALRDRLGVRSAKDGCSPQGQCGCCTVWVDGSPRVACVTPAARVRGRSVTTVEGLPPEVSAAWSQALCATGGSQCGFCTPGIVMRLVGAASKTPLTTEAIDHALLAHLCRCTGWQTIHEATDLVTADSMETPCFDGSDRSDRSDGSDRSEGSDGSRAGVGGTPVRSVRRVGGAGKARVQAEAAARAAIEGRTPQIVDPSTSLGGGGFADDTAPLDALVAARRADGEWVVGETLTEARRLAAKVQGRRTTAPLIWPIELPGGDWVRTLRTTWVEPGYLEPDASWCAPGGEPVSALANGGAFGGKVDSEVAAVARELADRYGRAVRVLYAREDVARHGPKRPPIAAGIAADGSGIIRVARTAGIATAISLVAPGLDVDEVDVIGPPTSADLRAAGWAEAAVLLSSCRDIMSDDGVSWDEVTGPNGARAGASIQTDGTVSIRVRCGRALDEVVLRSYAIGAAHMALGWVRSEGIAVDRGGEVHDLTVRSFGALRAIDTPRFEVTIQPDDTEPINGSEAVFAAVAAAAWRDAGFPAAWPCSR